METIPAEVGIDVSKDRLDVCVEGGKPFQAPNSQEGLEEIARLLPAGARVHLEASGGYERKAVRLLRAKGFGVDVHDPLRAKRLGQALSGKAKTDPLDARRLGELGRQLPSQAERSAEEELLRETLRAAQTLKTTAAEYKRRAKGPELSERARRAFEKAAEDLAASARELEECFEREAKGSKIGRRAELARSVPGIGPVVSRVLACELPPDAEKTDAGRIASFVGLAPMDDSSGSRTNRKRIAEGCSWIKKALYLAALACVRTQEWAKDLYARLRAKGRAHRQAMVAVMRRLLVRAHAVLKRGSPWKDETQNT
jgi:transposase